jgi:glycosyltransferase involved in cell wall biosynthesis
MVFSTNTKDSVTIIIPTLNRPNLVKRCINSIYNQNYDGLIVTIVVDSSLDIETEKITTDFKINKKNFKLIYKKNNNSLRPIDNWIYSIESIETKYAKFICDDDWLEPNFLNESIKIFNSFGVDCVTSNINVHRDFSKRKEVVKGYYIFEEGVATESTILDSFLGFNQILPVTPTSALFRSEILKEAFVSSLEHIECTKRLFGFDFYMTYYPSFVTNGTYLMNKNLSNSWAGEDSMTLNVKKANIAYCYFFALLKLIDISKFTPTKKQKKVIEHKLGVIHLRIVLNKEFKNILQPSNYKPKINIYRLLKQFLKKVLIKLKYKFI